MQFSFPPRTTWRWLLALDRVIPSFGVPRRLLSDRGLEFTGQVWDKLLRTLGVQRVLTSPYHAESNTINERSHSTMNNMLRAYLYMDGNHFPKWVNKIPAIMLTLNSMLHQPHWYSASMVATGRKTTLPPDLVTGANPAEAEEDHSAYVSEIQERLREVLWRVAPTSAPTHPNPYEPGNLIWVTTPPLERTSKLSTKWIGPYWILKVPNPFQVVYATGAGTYIVHIHLTKPALLDLITQELHNGDDPPTAPPVGYFPTAFTHKPVARNQAGGSPRIPQPRQPPFPQHHHPNQIWTNC